MGNKVKKVILSLLILCAVALVCYFGYFLVGQLLQSDKAVTAQQEENIKKKNQLTALPVPQNEADIYDNLNNAFKKNKDAVAWLEVPETDINNIVMQADDNDYYLRRNEDGESDIYGCYFADYECGFGKAEDFSQNTIVYGHSDSTDNKDGKRFAQLHRFNDAEFAQKVPYIYLTTPEGRFKFEIFSTFYTDTDFKYVMVNITEDEKLELAKKAKSLSIHSYDIEPSKADKLLTLSTCTIKYGESADFRFVVMARLAGQINEY